MASLIRKPGKIMSQNILNYKYVCIVLIILTPTVSLFNFTFTGSTIPPPLLPRPSPEHRDRAKRAVKIYPHNMYYYIQTHLPSFQPNFSSCFFANSAAAAMWSLRAHAPPPPNNAFHRACATVKTALYKTSRAICVVKKCIEIWVWQSAVYKGPTADESFLWRQFLRYSMADIHLLAVETTDKTHSYTQWWLRNVRLL